MYNTQTTNQSFKSNQRKCESSLREHFKNYNAESFGNKRHQMSNFRNRKSANISETDNAFMISLYAAGLKKENFKIAVKDNVLSISYNAPASSYQEELNFIHVEYKPASFERSFQLSEKVESSAISAEYIDGVLNIRLPKNPETNKPATEVSVN